MPRALARQLGTLGATALVGALAAVAIGIPVPLLTGPALLGTALALGGLPTDAFHFAGFLPQSRAARLATDVIIRSCVKCRIKSVSPLRDALKRLPVPEFPD